MLQYLFMALFLAWQAVFLTWAWLRRDHEPIKSRGLFMVFLSQVNAVVIFVIMAVYGELAADTGFSCMMPAFANAILVPMWYTPYLVRCLKLYYLYHLNDARTRDRFSLDFPEGQWLVRYRWLINTRIWIGIIIAFTVVSIGILLCIIYIRPDIPVEVFIYEGVPDGCYGHYIYIVIVEGAIALVISLAFIYFLYKVKDNFGLKEELRNLLICEIPVIIVFGVQGSMPSKFPTSLPNRAWALIALALGSINSLPFPIWLSYLTFYKIGPISDSSKARATVTHGTLDSELGTAHGRVPIESVNSSTLLKAILNDQTLTLEFKRFAAQSWCVENVFFYLDSRRYSLLTDMGMLHSEGWRMYRQYFDHDAPMLLNIDQIIQDNVQQRVIANEFTSTLFKETEEKIYALLKTDTLTKWRQTRGFINAIAQSALVDYVILPDTASAGLIGSVRKRVSPIARIRSSLMLGKRPTVAPTVVTAATASAAASSARLTKNCSSEVEPETETCFVASTKGLGDRVGSYEMTISVAPISSSPTLAVGDNISTDSAATLTISGPGPSPSGIVVVPIPGLPIYDEQNV